MRTHKSRTLAVAASLASVALFAAACSNGAESPDESPTAEPDTSETSEAAEEPAGDAEPVELTVNIFGAPGYTGDGGQENLFRVYESQNPHVTIKEQNLGEGGDALTVVLNAIGAGGVGLPDVQMIEEGWRGQILELTDHFVDLRDYGADELQDRWIDWKWEQGIDADGKVFGYGTDIGPQGICYDATLVEEALGISDRDAFAEKLGGANASWEQFWQVGEEFVSKSDAAWIGVPAFAWNSFVNQQDEGYYKADGSLNIEGNDTLKGFLGQLADAHNKGLTGKINAWSWNNDDFHGRFAVHICPGWMLGAISGGVESGDHQWDFADVFPGGATNWGGSFFSVPEVSENKEEAAKLAAWLTAPEQQIVAFQDAGAFPSQVEAWADAGVTEFSNELFNNAPVGEILLRRAEGVVAQFKGPQDSVIQDQVFGAVITDLNDGQIEADVDVMWQRAIDLLSERGVS